MILPVLYALAPVPDYVPEVVSRWADLVDVEVVARDCGIENAWYFPADDIVVLCTELFDRPELTRAILNHELAHAFMDQHGIPQSEAGADELGFFFMTDEEVYSIARWFLDHPGPGSDDGHPADLDRAGMFLCLQSVDEEGGSRECRVYYRSALEKWLALIAVTE